MDSMFVPAFLGSEVAKDLRSCDSVPMKQVGDNIPKSDDISDLNHRASFYECDHLIRCARDVESFNPVRQSEVVRESIEVGKLLRQAKAEEALRTSRSSLDNKGARRLDCLQEQAAGA